MSSLREIKDRIGSVRSTLKITSAMKLVASAKLRKAQKAIEGLRPYESALNDILTEMLRSSQCGGSSPSKTSASLHPSQPGNWAPPADETAGGHGLSSGTAGRECSFDGGATPVHVATGGYGLSSGTAGRDDSFGGGFCEFGGGSKVAVVAIASNSSLCGGFNSNVVKKTLETVKGLVAEGLEVEVHAIGRKMAEAMRKAGYPSPADYSDIIGHPEYGKSSALAASLAERFSAGQLSRVILVYNHFVSTAKQVVTVEPYLPFVSSSDIDAGGPCEAESDYIIEPSAEEVVKTLMPQVLMLKFHSAVLDSEAAEHAARTIAMQTATDNAQELLGDLTLEYNKGRQQKITSEILDLLGGASAQ